MQIKVMPNSLPRFPGPRKLALALAVATGVAASVHADTSSPTLHIRTQPITDTTSVAGALEGSEMAEARARIGGILDDIRIERGAWVQKGQILGVVKDKKLPQQITGLNAQVAAAELHLKRQLELLPLDAASPAQVEQARAALAALKAQQQNAGQSNTDGRIMAPFDGQVVALHLTSGTVMMPGESLATVAASPLRIKLSLPERHAALVTIGSPVQLPEVGAEGTVSRIYPQISGGRIMADVTLPQIASSTLRVGQKVLAQVATGSRHGIVIPTSYVMPRNGLTFVRLKSGIDIPVQTGYPQADQSIEVLSGLTDGDELVKP